MDTEKSVSCPRCGKTVGELKTVETGMRVALGAEATTLPGQVCLSCLEDLSRSVSKGYQLRMEQEQREKNKMMMWKGRVNLIKQARNFMLNKSYSDAAVCYEKYLRVLEIVYNKKKGELAPEIFNNSKRSKEMSVIASVYWDLMRIYDTSPRYGNRMSEAAEKLTLFIPFSPLYPDIAKKAETFARTAKNPQVVRSFIRSIKGGRGGCFLATAVYDEHAIELFYFRKFRDEVLKAHPAGRSFIVLYYRFSPRLANFVRKSEWARSITRTPLGWVARAVKNHLENKSIV